MINRTQNEINDFTKNIKSTKNYTELLMYMNSSLYSNIKLLISISSTYSIYWKVVLPFIISLTILFVLSNINPIGEQLRDVLNIHTSYIFGILLCFVLVTIAYVLYCKSYLISSMKKIKESIDKDK